jgi:hypothetical protein
MDLRTGKTYATVDDARADGVPESDIARVSFDDLPIVTFASGPFKKRQYKRTESGQLVRVDK